jgi:hypothetical protein
MEQLVEEGIITPCDTLIAEPTCPIIGEKGMTWIHITLSGDVGHSSLYPVIVNPDDYAGLLVPPDTPGSPRRVWLN